MRGCFPTLTPLPFFLFPFQKQRSPNPLAAFKGLLRDGPQRGKWKEESDRENDVCSRAPAVKRTHFGVFKAQGTCLQVAANVAANVVTFLLNEI